MGDGGGVFLSGYHCPSHHPLPFAMLPRHTHILEKIVSSPWGRVTQDPQASVDADHPNTASLLPQLLNWSLGLSALPGTLPASDLVTCHCAACLQPLSPAPFPPDTAVLPEGPVLGHHFFGGSQRSSASLRLSHLPKVEPSPGQSRSLPHLLL